MSRELKDFGMKKQNSLRGSKESRTCLATDLDQKTKEVASPQEIVQQRDVKLAEAEKV
ncbi:MAG: hypothetical protein RML93_04230 [Anaerolineales bacterium]|nr:hypothetical protein [Anaerolineales bacterium]MDW8446485.1 hypothetical protein [Anaerolineales bacterium]